MTQSAHQPREDQPQPRLIASSLLDGEPPLDGTVGLDPWLKAVLDDEQAVAWMGVAALASDVLRDQDQARVFDVSSRVMAALEQEPALLAPVARPPFLAREGADVPVHVQPAAAPSRRSSWHGLAAAAAAVMMVAGVAWQVVTPTTPMMMASSGSVDPVRLSDYLMAHDSMLPAGAVEPAVYTPAGGSRAP